MSKYLFIIESPGKQKKIQSFLGKDYLVIPTYGHILDLHPKKLSVDIKKNFTPTFEISSDKKEVVKKIREKAKKAELVYIATDLDREGSLIANGIISILPNGTPYKRVEYNAITKKDILDGIENAGVINIHMVHSAECRRILDRLVGWKSSYITKQATGGSSAGRVQSAALRILAEREKEIRDFVPQEYWPIEVELERKSGERVVATIKQPKSLDIKTEEDSKKICDVLKKKDWIVSKYETKEKSMKAYAPFTTSTMYQSASSILGWSSSKTAQVAQQLYESGDITYIRSDSTYIVPEFVSAMRNVAEIKYGQNYISSKTNFFSDKKNAQGAHEAIRVTSLDTENVESGDKNKLYKIIWKRTVASQMAELLQLMGLAEFTCDEYIFGATGSKVLFDGFRKCWDYGDLSDTELPEFEIGEKLKCLDVKTEQKLTSPPPHYTESSIVKELEKREIGRPSTFASIPETLVKRNYIEKQKNTIHTTDIGIAVSDFLVESDFCFVNLDFTAELETKLDNIADGSLDKLSVLNEFWCRLKHDIDNAKNIRESKSKTDYPCPKCGTGVLLLKHSKFGAFYTCSNRKVEGIECDYKADIGEDGEPKEKEKKEVKKSKEFCCPNCGELLIVRINKKGGEYMGCKNWKNPDCKGFYNAETGEEIIFKKKWKNYKKKKK